MSTTFYARIRAFNMSLFALNLDEHNSICEGDSVSLRTSYNFGPLPSDWYWQPIDRDTREPCAFHPQCFMELRHHFGTEDTRADWYPIGTFSSWPNYYLNPLHKKYIQNTGDHSIAHFIVLHVHNEWPRIMRSLRKFVCVWRQWYYSPGGRFEQIATKRFNHMKNIE